MNGNTNYLLGVFIVCLDIQQYNNAYLQVLMWSDLAYNDMITDSSICTYNGTVAPIGFSWSVLQYKSKMAHTSRF